MIAVRITLAGLISASALSCATPREPHYHALNPTEITQNIGQYRGKRVIIKGYLRYGDDARGLWTSQRAYLRARDGDAGRSSSIWNNCITLNAGAQIVARLRTINARRVALAGVVSVEHHQEDEIFSFSCNDVVLEVSAVLDPR